MAAYPNIKKRFEGRMLIWIIVLSMATAGLLTSGITSLNNGLTGASRSTYLEQTERIMAEQNRQMSEQTRAELIAQDERMTAALRRSNMQSGSVMIVLGLLTLGGAMLIWKLQDPKRSKLAKQAAFYAARFGEEHLEKAMDELEQELGAAIYQTNQIVFSKQWICGRTGLAHTPYAIPFGAVVGVYRFQTRHRNNGVTHDQYQLMLIDRLMTGIPMLLQSEKQLNEVYEQVRRLCPNAWHGEFPESYETVQTLEKEEQDDAVENILRANRSLGLRHCR